MRLPTLTKFHAVGSGAPPLVEVSTWPQKSKHSQGSVGLLTGLVEQPGSEPGEIDEPAPFVGARSVNRRRLLGSVK